MARGTLRALPPDRLTAFVRAGAAEPTELDLLSRESDDPFVLEDIIRSRVTPHEALLHLARTAAGRVQEALIANQARLLAETDLIRALLDNPTLTADGRRLLSELTEEFIEKEARRRYAAAQPAAEPPAPEEAVADAEGPEELGTLDEEEAGEESSGSPGEVGLEEQESLFIGALYHRIGLMTVSEKIKLAYTGSKEERRILIGDTNKLVGIAVLKSRALTLQEAESFASMRNLDEEIYRRISWNREWMRKPAVVIALVRNPRVPLDITLPLLKQLSLRELRNVVRDRNLSPAIRTTARRFLVLKRR